MPYGLPPVKDPPRAVLVEEKQCLFCTALRGKPHTLGCMIAYPRKSIEAGR